MQNSTPSRPPSSVPTEPSIDPETLARAYERARARMLAGESASGHLLGAFTARTHQHPDENTAPRARVTLDELLPVFREPIEWALARAEEHAQGDPVELAALDRVRAVYQTHLVWIGSAGALGEARPKVRPTDLLTVAGLVVGSLDPSFAQRTSGGLRESLLDALAAAIPLGLTCAPSAAAPHPLGPCCCGGHLPDAPAPFAPPRVPRAVVPMCCARHGHVL